MSSITYLGDPLFARFPDGRLRSRIVTVFPRYDTIVTIPTIHFFQIDAFVESIRAQRLVGGLPPMTVEEEQELRSDAVPVLIDGDFVQIRPTPNDMPLAFRGDRLLQKAGISKRRIKYLNVFNEQVRDALKVRGELWRIARLPTHHEEMKERILAAKTGIDGQSIYYYNTTTGTRWLTLQAFSQLASLDERQLRQQLAEIGRFSARLNANGNPEVAFYMADEAFTGETLAGFDFAEMDSAKLRAAFEDLEQRFRSSVRPEFQHDDLEHADWRHRMFSALVTETGEAVQNEVLLSLSPEFFMQIQWLPGGRIKNGELAFDEVFEEDQQDSYEENAREFLFNLMREYGDLEYVNIGIVVNSLSRRSPCRGRREVYLVVVKRHGHPHETVSVIRMQKWGVAQHLDENRKVPDAMFRSDEYTEYVLDRRFACRYLGMNIPTLFTARKICERYHASWTKPEGYMIWSPYFERAYIHGIATDKMPRQRFQDASFSLAFARLLGHAAASNLIVGRCDEADKTMFDDGDEVVLTDDSDIPVEIVVADQTGTFRDFHTPLRCLAPAYADPVNRRIDCLADPEGFARVYVEAFLARFIAIQEKYRLRRKAFATLFKVRPYDDPGCFADRWHRVLNRLDQSDPHELAGIIQSHLRLTAGCQPKG